MVEKNKNILIIGYIILLLTLIVIFIKYNNIKNKSDISDQNIKALTDSIRIVKDKYGREVASKNVLVTKNKDLKNLNSDLDNELKKIKGEVYDLRKIVAKIKGDTIYIPNVLITYPDNIIGLKFSYEKNYDLNNSRVLEGESKFKIIDSITVKPYSTTIIKDEISFDIITGLRKKDGNIEIFVTSNYPNLTISKIDGAIIDPKKNPIIKEFTKQKRFHIGPYIGYGFNLNGLKPTIEVGVGLSFSLFSF